MSNKDYVGDSVYAEFDEFGSLILTTENGFGASNRIVLEGEVWDALKRFVERMNVERYGVKK